MGHNGVYCKLSDKVGVKIIDNGDVDKTIAEVNFLKRLNRLVPGLFPKFRQLVMHEGMIGYAMEHIDGILVDHWRDMTTIKRTVDNVEYSLLRKGITWKDFHPGNLIVQPDLVVRAIDPDPEYFTISLLDKTQFMMYNNL
jgi:predicted unusual protein kinase regulating ubiquinone biosynthesis (AarF/ABC1/UbiB family)